MWASCGKAGAKPLRLAPYLIAPGVASALAYHAVLPGWGGGGGTGTLAMRVVVTGPLRQCGAPVPGWCQRGVTRVLVALAA